MHFEINHNPPKNGHECDLDIWFRLASRATLDGLGVFPIGYIQRNSLSFCVLCRSQLWRIFQLELSIINKTSASPIRMDSESARFNKATNTKSGSWPDLRSASTGERLESGVEVHLLEYVDAYPYTRDTSPEDWGTDGVSLLPDEILKWSTFQNRFLQIFRRCAAELQQTFQNPWECGDLGINIINITESLQNSRKKSWNVDDILE